MIKYIIFFLVILATCLSSQCHHENEDSLSQSKQKNFPSIEIVEEESSIPESWEYSGPEQVFLPLPPPLWSKMKITPFYPQIERSFPTIYASTDRLIYNLTDQIRVLLPYVSAFSILTFAAIDQLELQPSQTLIERRRIRLTSKMVHLIKNMLANDNDRNEWVLLRSGLVQLPAFTYTRERQQNFQFGVSWRNDNWSFDLLWNEERTKMSMKVRIGVKEMCITTNNGNEEDNIAKEGFFKFAMWTLNVKEVPHSPNRVFFFHLLPKEDPPLTIDGYANADSGYAVLKEYKTTRPTIEDERGFKTGNWGLDSYRVRKVYQTIKEQITPFSYGEAHDLIPLSWQASD